MIDCMVKIVGDIVLYVAADPIHCPTQVEMPREVNERHAEDAQEWYLVY